MIFYVWYVKFYEIILFLDLVMVYIRILRVDVVDIIGVGDVLIGVLAFFLSCYF